MKAYLITGSDVRYELPELVQWELEYGCATPCDSFRVTCLWTCGDDSVLAQAARFTAWHDNELVFTGVVDECEVVWSEKGSQLEVSGRGLAALLLDNEAVGMDYDMATIDDILRDHVQPYGIRVARRDRLPAVSRFSVSSGSSEWSVLYQFAHFHGGITPRFDRKGQLVLGGWEDSRVKVINDRTPLVKLSARDRRYGVVSEVWVRDRSSGAAVCKVVNEPFKAGGGMCRRLFTMPEKSNYQAMRYQGEYQLERSKAEQLQLQVDIALPFGAWPGELVRLERSGWGRNGLWRVSQATVSMGTDGYRTRLVLVEPETML